MLMIVNNNGGGVYARHNKVLKKITTLINHNITEIFVTENNAIMLYDSRLGK